MAHPRTTSTRPILRSIGIGVLAGMRTFAPPAWLGRPKTVRVMHFLLSATIIETVFDKFPFVPDRTSPLPLIGRVLSGAATAFFDADQTGHRRSQSIASGVTAAIAATASTYAVFHLRKRVDTRLKARDSFVGAAEDVVCLGLGRALAR